ncbi:CUE domain-containing protein [Phytophthora infestans]|uniref:CUE domain-containing protein n=1 Tax=Phytophthora infestans TaxID=4787 RepID=A0A8S9TFU8_PHYIN|nr:CUE domain-containing protein [Phytophthora infestans]KAI9985278.1 hypothetical protein PInf_004604 [Phytophthora infestans]
MTLAEALAPLVGASDIELQRYISNADGIEQVLPLLDEFFTRGTALQARCKDDNETRSLSASSGAVFSLFARLPDAPQLLQLATECGLLHLTRLAPFCQIFGVKNAEAVGELLDAVSDNVAAFPATIGMLRQLYIRQLIALHTAVQQTKRNQVTDLIRRYLELSLSIRGMTASTAVTHVLLLGGEDLETELARQSQSMLYALMRCYEASVPTLQRHLATFDETLKTQESPKIAEIRHALLLALERCVDAAVDEQSGSNGEQLLAGLHALSNGCADDGAEHGSYLSDLWHLCEYKHKVAEGFDRCKLDLENVSYLDLVIEQLPRRRILPALLVDDLAAETKVKTALSADATEWEAPETDVALEEKQSVDLIPMVNQVKDFFPDLGEGYVELCLLTSNLQVEVVINFLLEGNPPPVLLDAPQNLKRSDSEFVRLEAQITGKSVRATNKALESTKLDPSRVWVGKKAMEKTYDPQIAKKDQQLAVKMKQLVGMYEEEDEYGDVRVYPRDDGVATLDEYDDDYNDEFDDFVPFSVRDGGSADDQDAIREQNRRVRVQEEKEAFWEGMRNRNRENPLSAADDGDGNEAEDERRQDANSPDKSNSVGAASQNSSGPTHKSNRRKDKKKEGGEKKKPDEALTPQQIQRQRARKDKNKAKVANHNRKDRAMKKMG